MFLNNYFVSICSLKGNETTKEYNVNEKVIDNKSDPVRDRNWIDTFRPDKQPTTTEAAETDPVEEAPYEDSSSTDEASDLCKYGGLQSPIALTSKLIYIS